MKRLLESLAIIAGVGIVQASDMTVSLDDIVMLSQRDVTDETILVLLQNREIGFAPDADDIDSLLEAGVSEEVIRYLLQSTTNAPPDTNASAPLYTYTRVAYVDPYPAYYYRPYYARTSLFFGYPAFAHTSYNYRHHGAVHYNQPHHPAPSHLAHNGHNGRVTHTGRHGPEHIITGSGHGKTGSISHSRRDAGHGKAAGFGHSSRSVGHSRSGSIGHSRSISFGHRGGHSSSGSGGHSGGGHGGGH